ncbi:hypothetical protein Ccrd_023909 [Cynara cardunculus var. scolymus]|uniref:Uncharacterized protein n=1 Tax=Cynara cardunculus var. scolymus TaxID=59895 RepID=A0A103XCU9_CYNCS|nr:hypothetical protein Ccrd_023909 [Cynara cardunculus var. scolymus]
MEDLQLVPVMAKDVEAQFVEIMVTVWGICNKKEVLSTIRAKRKGARFWNMPKDNDIQSHTAPSSPLLCPSPLTIIKRRPSLSLNWRAAWKKS